MPGLLPQVVAGLLHDRFPNVTIQADQVAAPNFLFQQHLEKALTPGTAQAETLGPNSTVHWDYVLFQVGCLGNRPNRPPATALHRFTLCIVRLLDCKILPSGQEGLMVE